MERDTLRERLNPTVHIGSKRVDVHDVRNGGIFEAIMHEARTNGLVSRIVEFDQLLGNITRMVEVPTAAVTRLFRVAKLCELIGRLDELARIQVPQFHVQPFKELFAIHDVLLCKWTPEYSLK